MFVIISTIVGAQSLLLHLAMLHPLHPSQSHLEPESDLVAHEITITLLEKWMNPKL